MISIREDEGLNSDYSDCSEWVSDWMKYGICAIWLTALTNNDVESSVAVGIPGKTLSENPDTNSNSQHLPSTKAFRSNYNWVWLIGQNRECREFYIEYKTKNSSKKIFQRDKFTWAALGCIIPQKAIFIRCQYKNRRVPINSTNCPWPIQSWWRWSLNGGHKVSPQ